MAASKNKKATKKKLPDDVYEEIGSDDAGNDVWGKELEDLKKQRAIASAKKELAETDTKANKAKSIGQDIAANIATALSFGFKGRRMRGSDHDDKVKRLKEQAGMKKGGMVTKKKATPKAKTPAAPSRSNPLNKFYGK